MRYVLALLALAGLVVSILALRVHNMDPGLAPPCAVSEHWDCGAVNHSRFAVFPPRTFDEDASSHKLHIPIATIGIVSYTVMAVLALLGLFTWLRELALVSFMGAAMLTYLEAFVLEKWCIYCVWSQAIVTVLLIGAVVAAFVERRTSTAKAIRLEAAQRHARRVEEL
jgi:vitamin-K-epoxide reductase (warfarin-sensitive)